MAGNDSVVPFVAPAGNNGKVRALGAGNLIPRVLLMLDRTGWARKLGLSFGGNRDLYEAFGWDRELNIPTIMQMYYRGGVAKRIVEAKPDSTWGRPPRIYLPGNTAWSQEFAKLAWRLDLWDAFRRADILAGLGRFSIILIGTNRGAVNQPIPSGGAGGLKITYLQPYGEMQCKIKAWDQNPMSPRFGQPTMYTVTPLSQARSSDGETVVTDSSDINPVGSAFDVHWTRAIHITRGGLQSNIFGVPEYAPIWNYLCDLMKVIGASSESFWKQSYPGLHINVDKDMDLDDEDEANITAEMDEYEHGMRRNIRTRGVDVKNIGSKVADPRGAFSVLITLISGTTGIPQRILQGSEAGQLASSQDKANWAERIEEYRELHAEPKILWPFVMWCIQYGIVSAVPEEQVETMRALWPDAYRMSPLERGQTAAQTARSLANIAKGMQPIVLEEAVEAIPASPEQTDPITGKVTPATPGVEGKDAVTEDPLITRDEARRIIGLSTDQALLAEFPEDQG
jgi:hypothetical protein